MSKLNDLIQELCPNGVEYKKVGDVATIKTGDQLNKALLSNSGKYPVFNGGMQPSGYWSEFNAESNTIAISQGGASAGFVNFIEVNFWAGAHCYVVRPLNVDNKYLYYFLKNNQIALQGNKIGAGIPGLNREKILDMRMPVPPLKIQQEIVKILDKFTQLQAELQAELELRSRQYEYYRDELLSFDNGLASRQAGRIRQLINQLCPNGVKYKKLGEVAEIGTGSKNGNEAVEDGLYPFFVRSKYVKRLNTYEFDEEAIVIPGEGGIGDIFHYVNGKYALHQRVYRVHPISGDIFVKFVYYYMCSEFKKFILKKAVSATVTSIRKPMIQDFEVPVPPLKIQQEIAKILDEFSIMVSDISIGLPAEIKLRQQQYEYYRDKLLTFNPAN